jgi:mRNA interferase HigB
MHVISEKKLREFWAVHPRAEGPLRAWLALTKRAKWRSFADVRADNRSADAFGRCVIFDIGGNKWRLIARIKYVPRPNVQGTVFVRHVLTHTDYDAGTWKGDC